MAKETPVRHVLSVLPLACVMVAGPQIVSVIFLATGRHWARNSAAYLAGGAASVTLVVTIMYMITRLVGQVFGSSHHSPVHDGINAAVLVLLLILAVVVFRRRGKTDPPSWMGRLESASARLSFTLGFVLLGFFPSDLITSLAVGTRIGARDNPWWHVLVFVFAVLLLLAVPVLLAILLGKRAEVVLPRVRDWMNRKSWIVSEIVIIFFIGLTLAGLT